MILLAVIDPDVVIEPNDRAVVDVIEACFVDNKELIAFCIIVCNFV